MPKPGVDDFLAALAHRRKADIERLRGLIKAADPRLSETIKWNAPSYGYDDDRITMRLQPGDRVELIFHRGAKPKALAGFAFTDPDGLLKMITADRGVVSFADAADIAAKADALARLVRAWMLATA